MRLPNALITLAILLSGLSSALAQDIHLAHIHASPTLLNPAMTGLFNGDLRFIGNYRGQWNGFTEGYKTMVGNADGKLKVFSNKSAIGAGVQAFADKAGDLNFSTTSTGFSLSMLKALDWRGSSFIAVGIHNAIVSNRINTLNVIAFDKDPLLEADGVSTINYWDMNAGIAWFQGFGVNSNFHIGTSLFHINQPDVSFFAGEDYERVDQDRRLVVHGGADIRLNRVSRIKPNFIFMSQGPHQEITAGAFFQLREDDGLQVNDPTSIYLGAWHRWYLDEGAQGTDALIIALRFDYRNTSIAVSYDVNISKLARASWGDGGIELSFVKVFSIERKKKSNYKFECPDYY